MKARILLSSLLALALFSHCDDGGKKKTDKCKDVTCGTNAHCNADTGACVCDDGYTGDPDTGCTAGNLCDNVTCGTNAHCNPNTGACVCDDGYVGDPATECTASTLCENVTCGANATCNPNTGACECNDGYIGNPNTGCTPEGHCEANTCSGHGTCDDTSGTVVCTCDTGYAGTYCDTCDTVNGYSPDPQNPGTCVFNPCVPDPCYGHGTCTVENGLPVCTCNTGYTGGNCNRCDTANGYEIDPQNPSNCILSPCWGYDCGHGTCTVVNSQPTCTCDTGYTGTNCGTCDAANHYIASNANPGTCILDPCRNQTCSNHGTCSLSATDTAVCTCATGYAGTTCNACDTANGYIASTVMPGTCILNPCLSQTCSGHGTCSVVNDAAACTCATGWTGPTCSTCATGYTGTNCDACDTANGYIASTVTPGTCILTPCLSQTCSGHGTCSVVNDAAACTCDTGYAGTTCSTCDTAGGYVASNANPGTCIVNPCTASTCSGHGTCSLTLLDDPQCTCDAGYVGASCDACDTVNGYFEYPIGSGTCVDGSFLLPGDLTITEIMILSTTTPVENGQWFEITNTSATAKRMAGITLWADAASAEFPSDSPLILGPGERLVVGRNPDFGQNGGITVNQLMAGLALVASDGTIEIERTSDGQTIDIVTWDGTWNHQAGRSLSLSPAAPGNLAATLNDSRFHWCFGAATYGTGTMYGTPGDPNNDCRVTWCGLQHPASTTVDQLNPTELIYGQVYDALLTVGQDFSPFITAQVGYGATGTAPESWTNWVSAAYNPAMTGSNNEEFMGTLTPALPGTFDYLYRVSTDGGLSYQYCYWYADGTSRGTLTVNASVPCSPQVVISDVYGGGGSTGATWINDFVVLHNRSLTQTANISGWSLQYTSATGVSWSSQKLNLNGTIPPGGYYLIRLAGGTTNGAEIPTPDATGGFNLSATAGKIALVSSTTALSGNCPTGPQIVDFVGYGSTADCSEGSGPTLTLSNTTSGLRRNDGCTDTNNNAADFEIFTFSTTTPEPPKNSASPAVSCGCI